MLRRLAAVMLVIPLTACTAAAPRDLRAPRIGIAALRHGIEQFLAAHPLAADAEIRADEVARTAGASIHVVQVRGRERPHRHVRHDLVVHVLRGRGVLTLDAERMPMGAGDVAVVPRGVPHWFAADAGSGLAVALVTFAPPLDAPDSIPVPDVDSREERR
jgi:quercetin dioxygenase-like cupin family protein